MKIFLIIVFFSITILLSCKKDSSLSLEDEDIIAESIKEDNKDLVNIEEKLNILQEKINSGKDEEKVLSDSYLELQELKEQLLSIENNNELVIKIKDLEEEIKRLQLKIKFNKFNFHINKIDEDIEKLLLDTIDIVNNIILSDYQLNQGSVERDVLANEYEEEFKIVVDMIEKELSDKAINYLSMITMSIGSISEVEEDKTGNINYQRYLIKKNHVIDELNLIKFNIQNDRDISIMEYNLITVSVMVGIDMLNKVDYLLLVKGRFFGAVWRGIKKTASVVVATVVNVVTKVVDPSNSGGLLGWVAFSPIRFLSGLFYGLKHGYECQNFDFKCIFQKTGILPTPPTNEGGHGSLDPASCKGCHN